MMVKNEIFGEKLAGSQAQKMGLAVLSSAWVSASAGSGKTKMLIDRILILLLRGSEIGEILCLTYTKAAAYEMSQRLVKILSDWSVWDTTKVSMHLESLLNQKPDDCMINRAQKLFFEILDNPGGLNIQTIHSFCQNILKRFPLEAQIDPKFSLIDDSEKQDLIEKSVANVLKNKSQNIQNHIQELTRFMDSSRFMDVLNSFFSHYSRAIKIFAGVDDGQSIESFLKEKLAYHFSSIKKLILAKEFESDGLKESLISNFMNGRNWKRYQNYLPIILKSTAKGDEKIAKNLESFLKIFHEKKEFCTQEFFDYKSIFLTQLEEPRKIIITKKTLQELEKLDCDIISFFNSEIEDILNFSEELNSVYCAQQSYYFLNLAHHVIEEYEQIKLQKSVLDFNDLIIKTNKLLSNRDVCDWVLYKLDGTLKHVLIDEAQDTNPEQWDMLYNLVSNFFQNDRSNATLFVVGDIKQSIYSFQGANPKDFKKSKNYFQNLAQNTNRDWTEIFLQKSYRTSGPVLQMVDQLFCDINLSQGLMLEDGALKHNVARDHHHGRVEIWPLVKLKSENWNDSKIDFIDQLEFRQVSLSLRKKNIYAQTLARQIRKLLDSGEILPSTGHAICAQDILILVRKRSDFVQLLIRACRKLDIPICESDRFLLKENLVVRDLLSMVQFLSLPSDDFSFACLLKSSFFNLNENDLFDLAYKRTESLWEVFKKQSQNNLKYLPIVNCLQDFLNRLDYITPYELFGYILRSNFGLGKMQQSFAYDIQDIVDEFIERLLEFESKTQGTLQEFLYYMQTNDFEIKRDQGMGAGQLRIMTIHGSKGLEAPIVIMADAADVQKQPPENLLWITPQTQNDTNMVLALVRPNQQNDCALTKKIKQVHKETIIQENARLLYVAMTRAKDRLYVGGILSDRQDQEKTWYSLILNALEKHAQIVESDFDEFGQTLRFENQIVSKVALNGAGLLKNDELKIPQWLFEPFEWQKIAEKNLPKTSTPETQRGEFLHKIFEILIPINAAERRTFARSWFDQLPKNQQCYKQDLDQILNILENENLAEILTQHALLEVPLTGMIDGKFINVRIDCMVILENKIMIIDFKSDKNPPHDLEKIPPTYKAQLAQYKKLTQPIYPNYVINTYILWVENGCLIQLD